MEETTNVPEGLEGYEVVECIHYGGQMQDGDKTQNRDGVLIEWTEDVLSSESNVTNREWLNGYLAAGGKVWRKKPEPKPEPESEPYPGSRKVGGGYLYAIQPEDVGKLIWMRIELIDNYDC